MASSQTQMSTGSARRARSVSPDRTNTKKRCSETDVETSSTSNKPTNWPRFLVLSTVDSPQTLAEISPFAVDKAIKSIAGTPKEVKPMASGDLLVEVTERSHCENLMRSTSLCNLNVKIKVTPHKTLNSSRGVIYCPRLNVCDDEEMKTELRSQGVIHIKCITRKTPEGVVKSGSYILTFNFPKLPDQIIAGYIRIHVEPFIPNPLRCYNCQRYGHGASRCKHAKVCAKCGLGGHEYDNCTNEPQCVNCPGHHPSSYKKCPQWLEEKEIQKYKVLNNCSFKEARGIIVSRRPANTVGGTYASVTTPAQSFCPNCNHCLSASTAHTPEITSNKSPQTLPPSKSTNNQATSSTTQIQSQKSNVEVPSTSNTQTSTPPNEKLKPQKQKQKVQQSTPKSKIQSKNISKEQLSKKTNEKISQSKASRDSLVMANRFENLSDESEEMDTETSPDSHTSNSTPPETSGGSKPVSIKRK